MAKPTLTTISFDNVSIRTASDRPGKIYIAHRDGESGEFDRAKLGKVIEKFFNKHF